MARENRPSEDKGWLSSLRDNYQDFSRIVSPYFRRENAREIAFLLTANVALPIVSGLVVSQAVREKDQSENSEDYSVLSPQTVVATVTPIVGIALRLTLNWLATNSLRDKTRKELAREYLEQKDSMVVLKDHSARLRDLPAVPEIIMQDTEKFANVAIPLTIGSVGNIFEIGTMFYTASQIAGLQLAAVAGGISASTALGLIQLGRMTEEPTRKINRAAEEVGAILRHTETHRHQVAALRGQEYEMEQVLQLMQKQEEAKSRLVPLQLLMNSLNMTAFFAYPTLLRSLTSFYPEGTSQLEIDTFSALALHQMASVREIAMPIAIKRVDLETSMQRLTALQAAMEEVREFKAHSPLTIQYSVGDKMCLKGFSMIPNPPNVPDSTRSIWKKVEAALSDKSLCTIKEADLELEPGHVYRLAGKSGLGKSTLFKTCMGSWPYAAGEISFPCAKEEVYFMPQEVFVPYKSSLLQVMVYPRDVSTLTDADKKQVETFMKTFGLEKHIPALDEVKDWSTLSLGEKQRAGAIRILMSQPTPKILLLDEPAASIDAENASVVYNTLRAFLPHATIVYIDHDPEKSTHAAEAGADSPAVPRFGDREIVMDATTGKFNVSHGDAKEAHVADAQEKGSAVKHVMRRRAAHNVEASLS